MGLLDKLFGNKSKEQAPTTTTTASTPVVDCPHAVLVPRWENVKDMGHEDRVSRYVCEACHEEFSPEEGARLRDTINERLAATWQAPAEASTDK